MLLKMTSNLSVADAVSVMGDLRPIVESNRVFLKTKHEDGDAFVDETVSSYDRLKQLHVKAVKEGGEADRALSGRTELRAEIRAYVKAVKRRVRHTVRFVERKDKNKARAMLVGYGIRGNRKNLNRISHLELALLTIAEAHQTHGATLKAWGTNDAFIAKGLALAQQLPDVTKALAKERSEAEKATDARDDAYEDARTLFNDVLYIVENFGDEDDAVLADFVSAIGKHRALLSDAADDEDELDALDPEEDADADAPSDDGEPDVD